MNKTVFFLDMFSDYEPEDRELWSQAVVRHAVIDPDERRVSVLHTSQSLYLLLIFLNLLSLLVP